MFQPSTHLGSTSPLLRLLPVLVGLALFSLSSPARAYCESKTCELSSYECEQDERGCVSEGEELYWDDACLSYAVHSGGSPRLGLESGGVQKKIAAAFAIWREAECDSGGNPGFEVAFSGFVSCGRQQTVCGGSEANVNTVVFQDESWPDIYPHNAAALTSVVADLDSGKIVDADLEINSADFAFAISDSDEGLALDLVLAHEVGHFLGLGHSDAEGSLMNLLYQDRASVSLSEDDIEGICALFPPDEALSCNSADASYDACEQEDLDTVTFCADDDASMSPTPEQKASGCSFVHRPATSSWWALLIAALGLGALRHRRHA